MSSVISILHYLCVGVGGEQNVDDFDKYQKIICNYLHITNITYEAFLKRYNLKKANMCSIKVKELFNTLAQVKICE